MEACRLDGSAAHGARATAVDIARFLAELQQPRLIDPATAPTAFQPQYPELAGIVPGVGRFDPCPWGLGFEIRGRQDTPLDRDDEQFVHVRPLRRGRER